VFVGGLVLLLVSLLEGWKALAVIAVVVMIGVLVATARQRRTGPDPETVLRPGDERAWRPRKED
jgi:hypothetical protein